MTTAHQKTIRIAVGVLLLAATGALGARGQSLLSEPPAELSGPASTSAYGALDLEHLTDAALRERPSPELYAALRARFDDALRAARQRGQGTEALERRVGPALMRSGEDALAPLEMERLARAFVERFPDDEKFPWAFFYLTEALFRQDKPLEDSFFFDPTAFASLPPAAQSRYLLMQSQAAERRGDFIKAAEFRLLEWKGPNTGQAKPDQVLELLDNVADLTALIEFLQRYPDLAWLQNAKPFLEARALINSGKLGAALLALEALEHQGFWQSAEKQKFLLSARAEIAARVRVRPERIGVLLPLGSSAAAIRELAQETLDGLRMALSLREAGAGAPAQPGLAVEQDLQPAVEQVSSRPAVAQPRFELSVRDSANNPRQAAQMVEALVKEDHVIAIIGPIARSESEAAASKAEELGVPLISLSLSLDLPAGTQYAFRNSQSQEDEVRDLISYAVDYLNIRRMAILYPLNPYGERMMDLFWEEARRKDARVVAAGGYTPSGARLPAGEKPVGLKDLFESFTGLKRPLSEDDLSMLEALGESKPDPIVDFDGLFIPIGPDGMQDLRLIAPYPVTVDAEHVQLLGSRFWNDDAVLVVSGGKLEGSVFVDVYDRSALNPKVGEFQNLHRVMFGHRLRYQAPSYYTALGYDTLNMLMDLLAQPRWRARQALARGLKSTAAFSGLTGLTSFRINGEANKESIFFRIRGTETTRIVR